MNGTKSKDGFVVSARSKEEIRRDLEVLDLDCIKIKLMDQNEGLGWSRQKADEIEVEYKQFLFLCSTTGEPVVPSKDVDEFWHQHILDTRKYAKDCDRIFGFFIHHFPYLGMRGEEDAKDLVRKFQRSKELHLREFGPPQHQESASSERALCQPGTCLPGSCSNAVHEEAVQCGSCGGSSSCSNGGCNYSNSLDDARPSFQKVAA